MMKMSSILLCLSLTTITVLAGSSHSSAFPPVESNVKGSPVYRFWSENFKHQFLTISEKEKDNLITNDKNWRYDGIAYYAHPAEAAATTPGKASAF